MNIRTGIRAALAVVVIALLVACSGAGDAAMPDAGARGHTEPPPSIATAIARAGASVSDALSDAGRDYNPCGRMCSDNFWRTATPAEVQAELDRWAAVDAEFWDGTPLHLAAAYGKWPAVAALLDAGAGIDTVAGRDGNTPLGYALSRVLFQPNLDTIALLLEHGADPNASIGYSQDTPLHMTADPLIAALLIAHGSDVNAQNRDGEMPLTIANSVEIFTLPVASGADINASGRGGWPPLHSAVYGFQDAELVKLLLERGADINAISAAGETACDAAKVAIGDRQPSDSPSAMAEMDAIRDLVCP